MPNCSDELLKSIHSVEIEILREIDSFCKKNDVKYSLYCGTMLGVIRHQGFIPWDDDIDICMERLEYEKFIELWRKSNNETYILQNKDTDSDFSQSFTKIRKNHTTFLQEADKEKLYHKGIFVDVLPLDRIPDGNVKRFFFVFYMVLCHLFTREFVPEKTSFITGLVCKILLFVIRGRSRNWLRRFFLNRLTKFKYEKNLKLISANSMDGINHIMPSTMPDEIKEYCFEGERFWGYSDYDGMLTAWYNDYMQLPPEKDRVWKHRPLKVDFEHNYEVQI